MTSSASLLTLCVTSHARISFDALCHLSRTHAPLSPPNQSEPASASTEDLLELQVTGVPKSTRPCWHPPDTGQGPSRATKGRSADPPADSSPSLLLHRRPPSQWCSEQKPRNGLPPNRAHVLSRLIATGHIAGSRLPRHIH